jgi:hypothetical protein
MFARSVICTMILGTAFAVQAQEARDTAQTTIGGKQVSIEYGSPALKGRTLADLMKQLPADRIWRAGAGAVTTLEMESDLSIGGTKVSAGKYSLYMYCPENGDYALVFNSGEIGDKEVVRISLKQISSPDTEMLKYTFQPAAKGALLTISWGKQAWTVEFQPAG